MPLDLTLTSTAAFNLPNQGKYHQWKSIPSPEPIYLQAPNPSAHEPVWLTLSTYHAELRKGKHDSGSASLSHPSDTTHIKVHNVLILLCLQTPLSSLGPDRQNTSRNLPKPHTAVRHSLGHKSWLGMRSRRRAGLKGSWECRTSYRVSTFPALWTETITSEFSDGWLIVSALAALLKSLICISALNLKDVGKVATLTAMQQGSAWSKWCFIQASFRV